MTTSEARRQGLYNSLRDLIGPDNADTLMAHLPTAESSKLATREDIATLRADLNVRFDRIDDRFEQIEDRFKQIDNRFEQIDDRFEQFEDRFDRIENRFERFEDRFENRFRTVEASFNSLGERLDRIVFSLIGALLAMVTAFLVQAFI